jgi:methylmalonyl-CoA mutase
MEAMGAAFAQGATLGEIAGVLRAGVPPAPAVTALRFARRADPFERLRRRTEAHRQAKGHLPKVFLANMGPRKQHAARADFSAGFFAAGGLEVIPTRGFASVAEAADAAIASAAPVVTVCSTDDTYPEIVPALARLLAAAPRRPLIVVAGYPADHIAAFREAGVDEFIHLRANCAETLSALLQKLGL